MDEIQGFLVAAVPSAPIESALLTVLHVEVQGAMQDPGKVENWQTEALRQLRTAGGQKIELGEAALVAMFRQPTQAINCAFDLLNNLHRIGLDIRAAIHIGECEKRGDVYSGPVLKLAAGFAARAGPGDIIASRTVRDLSVGANFIFDPRGELDLPGIPGPWPFFAVWSCLSNLERLKALRCGSFKPCGLGSRPLTI